MLERSSRGADETRERASGLPGARLRSPRGRGPDEEASRPDSSSRRRSLCRTTRDEFVEQREEADANRAAPRA